MGHIGPEAKVAVPVLIELLRTERAGFQGEVSTTLGAIGPEAAMAVPALVEILEDPCWNLWKINAILALGKIGPNAKQAVPALTESLESGGSLQRQAAATALGGIGPEAHDAVPALLKLRGREWNPKVGRAVNDALARIRGRKR